MQSQDTEYSGARPRIDARTTAWLIAQRERVRALELDQARLAGELSASERIERAAQRYADKLEEKLSEGRKREASLARALGYVEAQRDQLLARLGEGAKGALPGPASGEVGEVEHGEIRPVRRPAPARRR